MNSRRVTALLLVAVGGAAGSAARATVALALPGTPLFGTPLLATFLVNMLGAFALAVLVSVADGGGRQELERRRERARLLLGTGFCGGFTTYSAVALHSAELLQGSAATAVSGYAASGYAAAGYAFGTLALGAVATLVGLLVGGRLGSPGARA